MGADRDSRPHEPQLLLAELRRLLQQHLGARVGRALDDLDSKLFALASSARAANEEQRLFDALRELRRQRAAVESGFLSRLGQDLTAGSTKGSQASGAPLSLFGRDELEERLAISSMVASVCAHLHAPLHALRCRLAELLQRPGLDDEHNPLGPLALAEGFRDAFLALDVGLDVRLLAYRGLANHVFAALEPCYDACNALLIAAGVLPELPGSPLPVAGTAEAKVDTVDVAAKSGSSREATSSPAAPAPALQAAIPGRNRQAPATEPSTDAGDGDLSALYRMMLRRRAAQSLPPAASLRGLSATREVPRERLLDATAELLRDSHAEPGELKRRLIELAQRQSPARVSLSAEDEGTVDLVDAIFERMSHDEVLPGPLARALKALRVPFLNAALRDQALMHDPEHPARRLIDEFGDTARGWSIGADPGQRLLRQMQALQSLLQVRGDSDAAGFDEALSDFREFAATQRMQAEQAEQRAIESTRSREALHQAQIDARLTLETRMREFTPSPWLYQLLTQHWSSYLVLVMLRHGLVSEHYRQAISFADDLLVGDRDSTNPFHAASFRARRLELETQLRQGMATLAYSDEEIVRLCGELHAFILIGAAQAQQAHHGMDMVESAEPLQEQPRPDSHDPDAMRHLRGLRPGTWFELGPGAEDAERGRLSWISPLSGRWMLVNWAGRKVADLPPERMAGDIARGLARVIGDAHLLRRAVDAVMTELQSQGGAADAADTHAEA